MDIFLQQVEELEEAREVFEEDHLKLSDVQKTQKDMVKEFEEIKALGKEIKEMKVELAAKANLKEMEEALALKGDLELVNTKVDQTEFETAIEELGEAIGLLGIKFQKKNEEWEERAADVWRAIDGKMSRDIFDEAVLKINSRLSALMYGLKRIKKVVEDLLYPDASGVTRCLVCRRPAGISGHECLDPKQIHKRYEDSSSGLDDKESFLKKVNDGLAKQPKFDEPPFCASRDTIISVPFSSSTYRSSPKETFPEKKVDLRLAPINEKTDHSRETDSLKEKSQVPKLPQINRHENARTSTKQKPEKQFSIPQIRAKQQHKELIFTKQVLAQLQREGKLSHFKSQAHYDPQPSPSQTTPSRERLMQDPLRREIILSPPETNRQYKPSMILAPLSTGASSYKDSSTTS
ncbi:unnamed protein product [Larinioides sclopetarius]|uniref:DUF4795 domain-containing protein n=1 Tax=Larinioides sclopetarius TaxID=280406 RepID=A0AAV2AM28_9ARAC